MQTFLNWIIAEARQPEVDRSILKGYEIEFKRQLQDLIQRTEDPELRQTFLQMLDCPVRDSSGRCRDFSEYILAALVRNGIHHKYDIEAAMNYILEKMLMDRSVATGNERPTLFGSFNFDRDFDPHSNPLQARFLTFLANAVRNIRAGRIPRLSKTGQSPSGTLSIGQGRQREDMAGVVSPDEIAARSSSHDELELLVKDIRGVLQRKEGAYGLPLVSFFNDMMGGMRNAEQRKKYGETKSKNTRQVIIQTIRDYAESSGNFALLQMLKRFEDYNPTQPAERKRKPEKTPKSQLPPKQRDFASIIAVIEKLGRPVGTADLGKYRRRWLDYAPRDPDSHHRNRLDATLEAMVDEDVLVRSPTGRGGYVYSPGPQFDRYREPVAA